MNSSALIPGLIPSTSGSHISIWVFSWASNISMTILDIALYSARVSINSMCPAILFSSPSPSNKATYILMKYL
jgi:hypothetical protein